MVLKVGIIGFGKMGALHAKGYINANAKVVGVIDKHAPKNVYDIYTCERTFLSNVDVVSICAPSKTHKDLALKCIQAGKPILVEKPLAMNAKDCEEIIKEATAHNVKVSVGHIERYNAGFKALMDNISAVGKVLSVSAVRTNPSSNRIVDVDVLADLTVHDLDIIRAICGGDTLQNISVKNTKINDDLDMLDSIQASFLTGGVAVNIHTCRVAKKAERTITVIGEKGTIKADLLMRKATLNGEEIDVPPIDQIDLQLKLWVDSVLNNKTPVVTMQDGLFAVKGSDSIRDAFEAK